MVAKRILVLCGWKIYPTQTGGHLRTACIAQALARLGHEVTIYSLAGRQGDYGWQPSPLVHAIEPRLSEVTHRGYGIGLLQAIGRRLGWPRVWQYYLLDRGWIPQSLRRAIADADIVISDLPYCPPVKTPSKGPGSDPRWYLISHNLEHRLLAQGSPHEAKWAAWMQAREAEAPSRYDAILACAQEDLAFFKDQPRRAGTEIVLVPNGIDPRLYRRDEDERKRLRAQWGLSDEDYLIVFSGSRFQPNLEALVYLQAFSKQHADFLAAERIHFLVLGSMRDQASREGALIFTGRVAATPPYFAAADAALNPIVRGSGSNVKLFEYLAAHLPILSTGFGVRGTSLRPDRDYLACERGELKAQLLRLKQEKTKAAWQEFAAAVWERHQASCDMEEIMRRAFALLPHGQSRQAPE